MSNLYSSKPLTKPLKGGAITSNVGNFDTVTANTLVLESVNIQGVFEDGILLNVTIQDSNIINTVIGLAGPNVAYFTELHANSNVTFTSDITGASAEWDPETGQFHIKGDEGSFKVDGCAFLGNLEICGNTIRATNSNGDINLNPNGLGSVYVNGPMYQETTTGGFYSLLKNGGVSFVVNNDINLSSSKGSALIKSFDDQSLSTVNGDIALNVDTGRILGNIASVRFTSGNINVVTPSVHNLLVGDVVNITNASLNGAFTVGSVISDNIYRLTTTSNASTIVSGGNFIKTPSNNILLNSSSLIKVPDSTKLTFGATCNNISGNSGGILISTCRDLDLQANNVNIPESTFLQLGTSSLRYNGTFLDINSTSGVRVSSASFEIDSTNTRFRDPILTISNFNSTSDNTDKGIEFRYYDPASNQSKLGWFGFKTSSKAFTFIQDATNTNEIISGSVGSFELSNLSVNSVNFTGSSTNVLNMACGKILNASLITGCGDTLSIAGSSNVNISASNRILLAATNDVLIPSNIPTKYGTTGSFVVNSANNLVLSGALNVQLATQSRGAVIVPIETYISFDGKTSGAQRIQSTTSGDLIISSNKDLYLTTTGGNIKVPGDTEVQFGSTSHTVSGNSGGIKIVSSSTAGSLNLISNSNVDVYSSWGNARISTVRGDIELVSSAGNVRLPTERAIVFGMSGTTNSVAVNSAGNMMITGNSTNNYQVSSFTNINLSASSSVNVPQNTQLKIGNDFIAYGSGGTTFLTNTNTTGGSTVFTSNQAAVNSTSLNIVTSTSNVSSGSLSVSGNLVQLNSTNVQIKDPIVTLGEALSDNKDRGIEYLWATSGSSKLGWFGRKQQTERFTFYSDAVNIGEVVTGTLGDLEVSSAYLKNSLVFTSQGSLNLNCGTIVNARSITGCSGQLDLNGNQNVNINSSTVSLNATSSVRMNYNVPLSFGTTNNSISCDSLGNMLIKSGNVVFDSNVQINGTTTNVYSTVTNIQDPIFSIGGVVGPIVNDNKDRGIEFKWSNNVSTKVGFFGYKQSLDRFVFIKDGVNNDEVFSGAYGDVQFGNASFGNVALENGIISGVREVSGGAITIKTTSGNINITPTSGQSVLFPYNTKVGFGNTQNSISSNTAGDMVYTAGGSISINTSDSLRLPGSVPIYIGPGNDTYIMKNTSNNLVVSNSSGDINLTPKYSSGNINIPTYNHLCFGSTSNSIYSDGAQLILNGYDGIGINSSNVTINGNFNIAGSLTAGLTDFDIDKYILPLGTYQKLDITEIKNSGSTNGNINIVTKTTNGNFTVGDRITIKNSTSIPVIDGEYIIKKINANNSFNISGTSISTIGTTGNLQSNLTVDQGKDVGIQVNYWSSTSNSSITSGSLGYKTGFFGFKRDTERWSFYTNSTIENNVVSGTYGDIQVRKVYTERMSGFNLEGDVSAGSNKISGTNFDIGGGSINATPIGSDSANTGRFTTLSNTVAAEFTNVAFQSTLKYNFERFTVDSVMQPVYSPSSQRVISMFSVSGVNYTSACGTMPSTSIPDGTYKILLCSSVGTGCTYTLYFGPNKLITPNPMNPAVVPTKLVFKRRSQSAQLLWDAQQDAWILLGSGCYIE